MDLVVFFCGFSVVVDGVVILNDEIVDICVDFVGGNIFVGELGDMVFGVKVVIKRFLGVFVCLGVEEFVEESVVVRIDD